MKRPLLFLVALATTALSLASCDNRRSPGENPQYEGNFSDAPAANATVTDRDSINDQQTVMAPIGKGSSGDTAKSAQSDLNSAPSGGSATTPVNGSGGVGGIDNTTSSKGDQMTTTPKNQ